MALILYIDTALENGIIGLSNDMELIDVVYNNAPQTYSSWIHIAIKELLQKNNLKVSDLNVISVTDGPGSYTGLRIGMSAAKGLCYALKIPIITVSNLLLYAFANIKDATDLYIPMIDARRMEVFTTILDKNLNIKKPNFTEILNEKSFEEALLNNKVLFTGNGAMKFQKICTNKNATFNLENYHIEHIVTLTNRLLLNNNYSNMMNSIPNYGKAFYMQPTKK